MSDSSFGSMHGLTAVVTGGSSGIGRAIAIEFARAGADVLVHCRESLSAAESVARECRALGSRAFVQAADWRQDTTLEPFVEQAWQELQGVDVWVNNAGADILTGDTAQHSFDEKLAHLLKVDVRATMILSRAVGRRMKTRAKTGTPGTGRRLKPGLRTGRVILNIGWDQADRGMEGDSGELFAAVKNAVMGFTRSLALSLAPEVRVNCLAPGWIRTAWGSSASDTWQQRVLRETPLGRWGTPEDVAAAARFLCSPAAAFITGQVINVNGGAVR